MENYDIVDGSWFIGETKYKAGIFASEQVAMKKKYAEYLKLEKFPNFDSAKDEFFFRYGEQISLEEFKLNRLFQVREKPKYSVFYTSWCCGMTMSDNFEDNRYIILRGYQGQIKWKHGLEYEDAVDHVLAMLSMKRRTKKNELLVYVLPERGL